MTEDPRVYILKCPPRSRHFINKITNKSHKFVNKSTKKLDIAKLLNVIVDRFKPKVNTYYIRHVHHTQMETIQGILEVLDNCSYWNRYKKGDLSGEYLRKHHKLYTKWGVYGCLYKIILEIYLKRDKYFKLKEQSIDSTFIRNLYGVELIQRNPCYKSKNGIKVSAIDDRNGVAHSIAISKGAAHDSIPAKAQINHSFIDNDPNKVRRNNRYRQNIRGDTHYYAKELKLKLEKRGYNVLTDANVGNTRNKQKLREIYKIKNKYRKSSKKRAIKETSFGWLHKYPKLDRYIEKTVSSYSGLLLLGYSITLIGKIK